MIRSRLLFLVSCTVASGLLLAAPPQQQPSGSTPAPTVPQRALLDKYCATCHNEKLKTGGLSLQAADVAKPPAGAETWEKVIRKLRVGAMPPQGMPRPDKPAADAFATYLETSIDRAALAKPNPGRATLHRLNRTEYANAVRDLLALEIDTTTLLPPDDESFGFDNIADVLKTSPSLLEKYMSASWNISRVAVGDPAISPDMTVYRVKPDLSQDDHLEGLPLGTHGGIKIVHNFPLDGEYEIRVRLWRPTTDIIRGIENRQQLEISVDGERLKVATFGGKEDFTAAVKNEEASANDIDARLTIRLPIKAGPRTVVATFLPRSAAQDDDIIQPFIRTTLDPVGYQGQPVVDRTTITGPYKATGPGDTPSRRRIFVCRPGSGADEVPCAKKIISALARRAFRRPVNEGDLEALLSFYQRGRNEGGNFDQGVEAAIQLILASPEFLFRFEPDPPSAAVGAIHRLSDLELASRLSFFLWSSVPDDKLINLASAGKLKDPAVFDQQIKRMLADPRSAALVNNFVGQWLLLRNLKSINPDFETFPDFDDNLRQAMRRETELFFDSIVREDRGVLDLLNANYTFVNERLARHYGIKGIYGADFQRITINDDRRRGLLGQASVLTVTSYSNRTSPVQRGKWILTNLLGTPPPPPPPNVPPLKENEAGNAPKSLRERMEAHRANPACASCHRVMDPVGFSLENFDALGQWRDNDGGAAIDPSGVLFNGTKVDGAASLRQMLLSRPEVFVGVFTEKLMTYALGRGIEYYDMPTVRSIVRDAAKNNYRFSNLVTGIIKSPAFQLKSKSPPSETPAVRASVRAMNFVIR
jgi:mono/diheme cytochrome c family protein